MSGATRARARDLILVVLCGAQLIESVDVTVVNVALPSIQSSMGFSTAGLQWVVSAYTVFFGGFLLLGGRCGDLFGKRRVFALGVAVFTAASVVSGLAPTGTVLIAGRLLQGLGAAMIAPMTLALIAANFAEGRARDRAMGIWGAVTGISASLGVVLGGLLTSGPGWRWIFFVNVPVGIALLAGTRAWLAPDPTASAERAGFDLAGAITGSGGLLALVVVAARSADHGLGARGTLPALALALALLAAFVAHELLLAADPLVPLRIFANRRLAGANLLALLVGSGMLAMFFFVSIYEQRVLGYSPLRTGLNYLPLTIALMLVSLVAPRLVPHLGLARVLATGCVVAAAGMMLLGAAGAGGSSVDTVILPSLVVAVGLGLTFVPMTMAALSGVAPEQAGLASALANVSRTAGGALGLAVISSAAAGRSAHLVAHGTDASAAAAASGIALGFRLCAALLAGAAAAAVMLFRRARAGGEPVSSVQAAQQ